MVRRTAVISFRLILILMFAYSGYSKFTDPAYFMKTLEKYELFSEALIPFLTFYVPVLEILLAVALSLPFVYKQALVCNLCLLLIFEAALLSLILRDLDVDCGCLGSFGSTPLIAFIRNIIIIATVIFLISLQASSFAPFEWSLRSSFIAINVLELRWRTSMTSPYPPDPICFIHLYCFST